MRRLELEVEPAPHTPAQVRGTVRDWVTDVAGSESTVQNVCLIVSELVTNSVVHAQSALRVVVTFSRDRFRIEVHDDNSTPPMVHPRPGPHGGFGLRIVAETSESWGWQPTASGKVVWAEMVW